MRVFVMVRDGCVEIILAQSVRLHFKKHCLRYMSMQKLSFKAAKLSEARSLESITKD